MPHTQLLLRDRGDEATGLRLLRSALEVSARRIATSSGADPGVVVDRTRNGAGA